MLLALFLCHCCLPQILDPVGKRERPWTVRGDRGGKEGGRQERKTRGERGINQERERESEREKRERGRDDVDRKDKTWGKEDKRGGERERKRPVC